MPTYNTVDMMNCAQGLHSYDDDGDVGDTCTVCGHVVQDSVDDLAPAMLGILKAIIDHGNFDDDGDFYIPRHDGEVYAANPDMVPPDELIERATRIVASIEKQEG